jgi:protein Tob/BTG
MKAEIRCAVDFISQLMVGSKLPYQFVDPFRRRLEQVLLQRFKGHWNQDKPLKGSAYRCIRINEKKLDPLVSEAAKVTGLSDIRQYLPKEFTMWIDPKDVSYRFGEDGSISQLSLEDYKPQTSSPWTSDLTQLYNVYYGSGQTAGNEISVKAS